MALAKDREAWVSEESLAGLSELLGDPPSFAGRRHQALERFRDLPLEPNPLYRQYGYFNGVDLTGLDLPGRGPGVARPALGKRTVQVIHDASGTHVELSKDLADTDIACRDLTAIWAEGGNEALTFSGNPEGFTDRLTALGTATLNRGYSLDVPAKLTAPVRLQDISVLSRPKESLSVRRVVHVGEGSSILATEELFSTPNLATEQRLYASSTEVRVGPEARAVFLGVHAPDANAIGVYTRAATLSG
ncbi:MAG: hypothetical protein ACHQ16_07755, partial [Candidatus Lutacidiplasmatales archaeon]